MHFFKLSLFALLLTTIYAPVSASPRLLKIDDGTAINCIHSRTKSDSFKGAYQVKATDFRSYGEEFEIDIEFRSVSCPKNEKGDFKLVPTDKEIVFTHFGNLIDYQINTTRLVFYSENNFNKFEDIELTSAAKQNLVARFHASALLTPEELEQFAKGETVTTSFQLHLRKHISIFKNNLLMQDSQLKFGSFRVHLKLKNLNLAP